MDILHAVGNTSLVALRRVVPSNGARLLVKLEWENPTGSRKDRMARAVITRAEEDGRLNMAALGAELSLVPSEGGQTTKQLILDMIEAARELSREPHTCWTDQLTNPDSVAGYHSLGEEIWDQTSSEADAFVHSVRTAASLRGAATVLKRHKPGIRVVAVEPAESAVLGRRPAGGRAAGPARHGGHADGGLRPQVPQHGRVPERPCVTPAGTRR